MNIGFIGMGNMGQMLVGTLVRSAILQPNEILISSRNQENLNRIATNIPGIQSVQQNSDLLKRCSVIFLCTKPTDTRTILQEIGPYITADHLFINITNSLENSLLERLIPARIAKVIPSVVQQVHAGASLLIFGTRCTAEDKALLHRLFGAISHPYTISESQARVASDLTSCGPAFISHALRSLAQAARAHQPDLSAETVDAMVRLTTTATLTLMAEQGLTFDDIIHKVSTPGGVTADGIAILDEQMTGIWEAAIQATITKEEAKKAAFMK